MKVSVHQVQPGRLSVQLEGPFTMDTVPEIRREVLRAARSRGIRGLEMDLSRVSSMDTAGIAVLVELLKVLARRHAELRLSGLSDTINRMIHLARLAQVFEYSQSV